MGVDYSQSPPIPFLCDFKTGFDVGYTTKCSMMSEPFENIPDHQKNQHHLQLAWELEVCLQEPYTMPFKRAYILLVNKKGVKKVEMPPWCTKKRKTTMINTLIK